MYQMKVAEIVDDYRDISEELTRYGFDLEQRAALLGKSTSTLKHFGGNADKKHWRLISAEDLDRLREKAVELYWEAAADPYRVKQGAAAKAAGDHSYITPTFIALDVDGKARLRHPHPIRCQEVADVHLGSVIDTHGVTQKVAWDSEAALRSNWRRLVTEVLSERSEADVEDVCEEIAKAAGVCRYSLFRVALEYQRWNLQPTPMMILGVASLRRDI